MGEAKRRKLLDPEYGKDIPIVFKNATAKELQDLIAEAEALIKGTNLQQDFGHNYLKMFGVTPSINAFCDLSFSVWAQDISLYNGFPWSFSTSTSNGQLTARIRKKTYRHFIQHKDLPILTLVPCIEDRYLNDQKTEWIIPMYEYREGIDSISC